MLGGAMTGVGALRLGRTAGFPSLGSVAATLALLAAALPASALALCEGTSGTCGQGTTALLSLDRLDVAFTIRFGETDYVRALGSPSEELLQGMVCAAARSRYAVEFCFATFDPASRTLSAHLLLLDASRVVSSASVARGNLTLSLAYRPLVREAFPSLSPEWEERTVALGSSHAAAAGDVVRLNASLPVAGRLSISGLDHAPQLPQGHYSALIVRASGGPGQCLVRVVRAGEAVLSAVTERCGSAYLAAGASWPPGTYEVRVLALSRRGEELDAAERSSPLEVVASPSYATLALSVARPSAAVVAGEPLAIELATEEDGTDATVTVLGPDLSELERHEARRFKRTTVELATRALGAGEHLALAQVRNPLRGDLLLSARFHVEEARSEELEARFTDKEAYTTEESIRVSFPGLNALCTARVRDRVGTTYAASGQDEPCASFFVDVPDTVPTGEYEVEVEARRGPSLLGLRRAGVRIERVERRDRLREVCRRGRLALGRDVGVPCLRLGERCSPGQGDMPSCLCTNGEDVPGPLHVCLPGAVCREGGCEGGALVSVDESGGLCSVRAGLLSVPCAREGTICAKGSCSCLDAEGDTLDVCTYGELCGHAGCAPPALVARVLSLSPDHARRAALGEGVEVEAAASLRYKGEPLTEGADASLIIEGREHRALSRRHAGSGVWRFGFLVRADLGPGQYRAYLRTAAQGEAWLSLRAFEVWHDDEALAAEPLARERMSLDFDDLRFGTTHRLLLTVADGSGRAVTELPASAFRARLGDAPLEVSAASYDPSKGYWEVDVLLRNATPERIGAAAGGYNATRLTLEVAELGRRGLMEVPDVRVYARERPTLEIVSFEPHSYVYQLEACLGFDLDVNLNMKRLTAADLGRLVVAVTSRGGAVHGGGRLPDQRVERGADEVVLVSTAAGVRATVRGVAFCHPPVFVQRSLSVNVSVPGVASDEAPLPVHGNPTWFLYPRGSETRGCEPLRAGETAYGASISSYEVTRSAARVGVNTTRGRWPAGTVVALELAQGFPLEPDVWLCDVPADRPNWSCRFDGLGLRPGSYALAASIRSGDLVLRKVADTVVVA